MILTSNVITYFLFVLYAPTLLKKWVHKLVVEGHRNVSY
nr:MAG TPA: hypothetical protein [Caudoviricetes sp.]